ncbi:MAG TPA: alanine racemase [Candidatus Nanopelagicales bacterium]|nr:alanine racemase [Candidatus Nanopelagicales bacterium]
MTDPGRTPGDGVDARLRAAGLPPLPRTAWLEVDLDRLAGNLAAIRAALPGAVTVEVVVKADAYGHGAVPVAHAALAAGARGLCVATLDEALELRRAGISAPVFVLFQVPPDGAVVAARAGVAIAASDAGLLEASIAAYEAARRRARRVLPDLGVQLAIETGLGRDGLTTAEAVVAGRLITASPGVVLRGAWSHLQAPADRGRSDGQVDRFGAAVEALRGAGIVVPHRHLLASGGLLAVERLVGGERPVFDGLRVGLAAYGILPDGLTIGSAATGIHAGLRPVLSLHARPIRVADLPADTGISYGPSFVTARPSRIATLPLGYADGWVRTLSNRATALVRGRRVPLVGNVAMDAVMADVTDVPGPPVTCIDEFVLLGAQGGDEISAGELAQERTTISWEVVAVMSRRLTRVYTARAVTVGIRTLTEERGRWRSLRSGTATSATSRSTRS